MSDEITVPVQNQTIYVNPISKTVSVILTGPAGPAGASADNVFVSNTPPSSPAVGDIWIDTT